MKKSTSSQENGGDLLDKENKGLDLIQEALDGIFIMFYLRQTDLFDESTADATDFHLDLRKPYQVMLELLNGLNHGKLQKLMLMKRNQCLLNYWSFLPSLPPCAWSRLDISFC